MRSIAEDANVILIVRMEVWPMMRPGRLREHSDDDPEKIRHVIRCAKKGCFAEQMVVKPVPLTGSIKINGQPFEL